MLNKLVVTSFPVLKYSVVGRCGETAPFRTLFWPKCDWPEVFDQLMARTLWTSSAQLLCFCFPENRLLLL